MKIIVHRGSAQIGGSCIEVSSGSVRIILDAGLPLDASLAQEDVSLPVARSQPAPDAIFLSHAHADHSGLVGSFPEEVPVWMNRATSKMVLAGSLFAQQPVISRRRTRQLTEGHAVEVGGIRVTAYPVDHSIFGAVAFLVEADGKRVLYTADLRLHGRKPGMTRRLIKGVAAEPLDALIIEGTRLGERATEANTSESDLESVLTSDCRATCGVVLAMYSPLNVDRFVTFFRAARRSKRTMVIDPYQAFVLHLARSEAKLPAPSLGDSCRVLIPPRFPTSTAGKRLAHTEWVRFLPLAGIAREEILAAPEQFVLLFRESMQSWLYPTGLPREATCVFSYWPGYLREAKLQALQSAVIAAGGRFLLRHASGHAHADDLRWFAEEVRPRLLIPVHTNNPKAWLTGATPVRVLQDGEEVSIGQP